MHVGTFQAPRLNEVTTYRCKNMSLNDSLGGCEDWGFLNKHMFNPLSPFRLFVYAVVPVLIGVYVVIRGNMATKPSNHNLNGAC